MPKASFQDVLEVVGFSIKVWALITVHSNSLHSAIAPSLYICSKMFACTSEFERTWLWSYPRTAMNQKFDLEVTPSLHATFAVAMGLVNVSFVLNGESLPERFSFSFPEAERVGNQIEETGVWTQFPVIGVPHRALKTFGRRLRDYAIH